MFLPWSGSGEQLSRAGFTTATLIADLPKQTALVAASDLADPARRGIRNFGER
jgi:hypothetical protein